MLILSSNSDSVLAALAEDALQHVKKRLYGCGNMDHANLIELVRVPVDAVVGLTVHEAAVTLGCETRAKLAQYYAGVPIFVDDALSIQWLLHYGHAGGQLGTNPAWAAGQEIIDACVYRRDTEPYMVRTVGEAILGCLAGLTMRLEPRGAGQGAFVDGRPVGHHPLTRFAARYALPINEPCEMPEAQVNKVRAAAVDLIRRLEGAAGVQSVDERIDKALGVTCKMPARPGVRRLKLGEVFDPSTHYTAEYYDGRGIEYCRPDGTWEMYHGTALYWEGFGFVASRVDKLLGRTWDTRQGKPSMLDVGSAAGAFVSEMLARKWDAYGVDLSREAHSRAKHPERLIVGDITHKGVREQLRNRVDGNYDLITAWDLLEHIYQEDVDLLLRAVRKLLTRGGIFWSTICTRGEGEQDFIADRSTVVTKHNSWALVAGHVNIRTWQYWAQRMDLHGFVLRYDLMHEFQVARSSNPVFRQTASWAPRNTLIVEKAR